MQNPKPMWYHPWPSDRIMSAQQKYGYYEIAMLRDVKKESPRGGVFLDVGACFGNHTIYFCLECKAMKVYSFEPYPPSYQVLLQNLKLNKVEDRVAAFNMALGAAKGTGSVEVRSRNNLGMNQVRVGEGEVQIETMDSVTHRYGIDRIDVAKIDVEYMEMDVISGGKDTLKRCRPLLYVECAPDRKNRLVSYMKTLGYRYVAYLPGRVVKLKPT